jgi:hypothetical protein
MQRPARAGFQSLFTTTAEALWRPLRRLRANSDGKPAAVERSATEDRVARPQAGAGDQEISVGSADGIYCQACSFHHLDVCPFIQSLADDLDCRDGEAQNNSFH